LRLFEVGQRALLVRLVLPSTTLPLHEPQAPFLQPYGRPMPARMAAERTVSSASQVNWLPLGWTVIWKVMRYS
jgi:hypothetical protein